jgi:hypothetical protein
MILVLLEALVSSACIHGEGDRSGDGNALKTYRDGVESKINSDVRTVVAYGNGLGLRAEPQKTRGYGVRSRRDIVGRVAAKGIGGCIEHHLAGLHDADFR